MQVGGLPEREVRGNLREDIKILLLAQRIEQPHIRYQLRPGALSYSSFNYLVYRLLVVHRYLHRQETTWLQKAHEPGQQGGVVGHPLETGVRKYNVIIVGKAVQLRAYITFDKFELGIVLSGRLHHIPGIVRAGDVCTGEPGFQYGGAVPGAAAHVKGFCRCIIFYSCRQIDGGLSALLFKL